MRRREFVQSALAAAAAVSAAPRPSFAAATRLSRTRLHDLEAVTGDGRTVSIPASAIADLRARMRGPVLLSGDNGYDDARLILSPSFNRFPALIAQPTGPADVMAAVDFARDHGGLLLAVKCGGHSFSGMSTCDRGMMIDLSRFRHVSVDPVTRKAWVAGGTLLGQLDHEAMAHGLVTTMGTVSHTGVGGLVTGGGFGRLGRRFGLSIDNLTGVQVVPANGRLVRANADENADLFWGVRGGGGNFGVVTSFEFRLHPMQRQVMAGPIVYPIALARQALTVFAEQQLVIPDELAVDFVMVQPPGDAPGVFIFEVFYSGAPERLDALLAPIRRLGTPLTDGVAPRDYVAVQRSGDVSDPRAQGMYLKGGFVPDFTPALIDSIVDGSRATRPGRRRSSPRPAAAPSAAWRRKPRRSRSATRGRICFRPSAGRSAKRPATTSTGCGATGRGRSASRTASTSTTCCRTTRRRRSRRTTAPTMRGSSPSRTLTTR
jgi:hypothetical protein